MNKMENLRNAFKVGTAISRCRTNPSTLSSDKHVTLLRLIEHKITTQKICALYHNYSACWNKDTAIDIA